MTTFSDDTATLLHQASVWLQDGKTQEAEEALRRILALDPTDCDALNLLGILHRERGDRELGARLIRAAISINPDAGRYHVNLANMLGSMGDRAGAIASYRRAVGLNPTLLAGWAGVIFEMDLHPWATPDMRMLDRRAFNEAMCAALTAKADPFDLDPNPRRKLHVGYLGPDFCNHSAAMVFGPMLDGYDKSRFTSSIYWNNERASDEITDHFRQSVNGHFREVKGLDDDALAAQIREDKVDILVELAGFSTGARPLVLARKPAPVIVTAWGHITGLGMDAVDYLLADDITVPPEHEGQYHERVLRAPCTMAYNPWSPVPELAAPPAGINGFTTFGYFGRPSKTNPLVWGTWAQLLRRVPGSRLILKHEDYRTASCRQRILDAFSSLRVADQRVEFRYGTSRFDHLAQHHEVDIALDPFPQNGGVTLLEATLMGLPSVALLGNHLNGRIAASILDILGHPEWVAQTPEEYVEIAAGMAERGTTVEDRMALRDALLASVLCRPGDYAGAVEKEYRRAWRAWCATQREEQAA